MKAACLKNQISCHKAADIKLTKQQLSELLFLGATFKHTGMCAQPLLPEIFFYNNPFISFLILFLPVCQNYAASLPSENKSKI